jgi:hypothetical protein
MSKKSVPGDGTNGCGVKGGGLYGAHFAVPDSQNNSGLIRTIARLTRLLRTAYTA